MVRRAIIKVREGMMCSAPACHIEQQSKSQKEAIGIRLRVDWPASAVPRSKTSMTGTSMTGAPRMRPASDKRQYAADTRLRLSERLYRKTLATPHFVREKRGTHNFLIVLAIATRVDNTLALINGFTPLLENRPGFGLRQRAAPVFLNDCTSDKERKERISLSRRKGEEEKEKRGA